MQTLPRARRDINASHIGVAYGYAIFVDLSVRYARRYLGAVKAPTVHCNPHGPANPLKRAGSMLRAKHAANRAVLNKMIYTLSIAFEHRMVGETPCRSPDLRQTTRPTYEPARL